MQQFDTFYSRYGLRHAPSGTIAAWGINANAMTHGCVSGPAHGPRWESKCGSSLRIQHGLNELMSSTYGRVLAFYSRIRALSPTISRKVEAVNEGRFSVMLSEAQIAAIKAESEKIPRELHQRFEESFAAWKASWSEPHIVIGSDPRAVTHTKEFHELVALGPAIIPAVVEKLLEPDNFFALQLYDAIQPEHHMVVALDLGGDDVFEGEQGRARRTAERFASSL
jgi:hypothetical protein